MDIEEQYDKIYRYCYFKIYDKQLAEDITQETFLRYYRQNLRFDNNKELPYLYTIAKNLSIDMCRKKTVESLEKMGAELTCDQTKELIDNIILHAVISRLPDEEQEMIFLRYVNEVSITSISTIMGISRFVVYRKLKKTLKWLKEELEKEGFLNE